MYLKNKQKRKNKSTRESAMCWIHAVLLLCILPFFVACGSKNIVIETRIVSGGDTGERATLTNNVASHVDYADTVAFYKSSGDQKYQSVESNPIRVYILDQMSGDEEKLAQKKILGHAILVIQKYIIEHSFWSGKQPTMNVSVDKKGYPVRPFNYNIRFSNMGPAEIEEIVYVDSLPKELRIKDVHYYSEDQSNIWASDFDDMVWEIQQKNGMEFLIVRFLMKKRTMKTEEKFILRVSGELILK